MITIEQYFGTRITNLEVTEEKLENARILLERVNALLDEAFGVAGILVLNDPDTGTQISGSKGGEGGGGFRLSNATTGKPASAHKLAMAVDVFDPDNKLDDWITREILVKYGLWREARQHSPGWVHLQTREPKSHMRSFNP